ncbi:hypothetical protein N0V93_001624 [Gnomoniopsis smithogilvyi]|uniref:Zn(2)-C6 fungal-type domain-containing protein n=1 Tax=Gnomoniopsis smithogilvyi TaxID=1191159 RepID=A0A9W9D1D8_9PEZI|nr:hypothetical protein N0V93_001624 [Gnomoniopsis smithogilvyi]
MPERRRAQHRKSRRGCLQCKQRHTKCDETRPECANCKVVGRQCEYAQAQGNPPRPSRRRNSSQRDEDSQSPSHALASGLDIDRPSPVSNSRVGRGHLSATATSPASSAWSHSTATSRLPRPPSSGLQDEEASVPRVLAQGNGTCDDIAEIGTSSLQNGAGPSINQEVNVDHMELLIHFSLTKAAAFTEFEKSNELLELGTNLILQKAVTNTTLLHQVLAISARYLSLKRPERHDFYAHQAVQMQTKAIELFNKIKTFDESNCEAMLLFSSLLNRQVLADALSNREGDFSAYLDRFIQAGQLNRGIRVVSHDTWPMLLKSDLSPLLQSCDSDPVNRQGQGKECEMLRQLIAASSTLDPICKEACRSAVHFLQIGFDDVMNPKEFYTAYNMIYSWFIFLPKEFVELLTQHKPESLAILGYYAVLLHYERENWVVGDSGAFLLRGVSKYLGAEWAHWLDWPLQQLSGT